MNAQMKRTLVCDQDSEGNPGPPREGDDGQATPSPVQPPIQRPDGDDPESDPPPSNTHQREPDDPPTPTPNDNIKPIDRPGGPDAEPGEPSMPGPERG